MPKKTGLATATKPPVDPEKWVTETTSPNIAAGPIARNDRRIAAGDAPRTEGQVRTGRLENQNVIMALVQEYLAGNIKPTETHWSPNLLLCFCFCGALHVPPVYLDATLSSTPLDSTSLFCFYGNRTNSLTIHIVDLRELSTPYDYQHWLSKGGRTGKTTTSLACRRTRPSREKGASY